jgi:hypothetical protein
MTDMLTHDGITQPINEWALDYGIYPSVITDRLARGWTTQRAITTPMIVAPGQQLLHTHLPGIPRPRRKAKPKSSSPRPRNRLVVSGDVALTISQWSELTGISKQSLRNRIRRGMTMADAIAVGILPSGRPGVGKNFAPSTGTGAGSTTQDIP